MPFDAGALQSAGLAPQCAPPAFSGAQPDVQPFVQAQLQMLMQLQLMQMLGAWLQAAQAGDAGPCQCRRRGALGGQRRSWGRMRRSSQRWDQARRPPGPRFGPQFGPQSGQRRRRDCLRRRARAHRPQTTPQSVPQTGPSHVPSPALTPGPFDGCTPAPQTTSQRAAASVSPPLTNSAAQGRDPNTYSQVINQFAVGDNPRYARRNGNTYCNIYAWDVTRAMGAELPHWRRQDGSPAEPFERGAWEMNANGTARWLSEHGERHGWRQVSAAEAQAHANGGAPAVAIRENPDGIGHVAVVRPGEMTDRGPCIAQAGGRNFNEGHVRDVWRNSRRQPQYWVHD